MINIHISYRSVFASFSKIPQFSVMAEPTRLLLVVLCAMCVLNGVGHTEATTIITQRSMVGFDTDTNNCLSPQCQITSGYPIPCFHKPFCPPDWKMSGNWTSVEVGGGGVDGWSLLCNCSQACMTSLCVPCRHVVLGGVLGQGLWK